MIKKTFFVIGFFFLGLVGQCQLNDLKIEKRWIDLGIGFYSAPTHTQGINFSLGANLIHNRTLGRLKTTYYKPIGTKSNSPKEQYYSVGILIGREFLGEHILLSGGLGLFGGSSTHESYDEGSISSSSKSMFFSPSIPLEIDFMVKPLSFMGIGISAFADLNLIRPIYGVALKLGIGKLR